MKLNLLKLSLKKELLCMLKRKTTFLLILVIFIMPFGANNGTATLPGIISEHERYFLIINLGVIAMAFQYFLDSIYQDKLRKVDNFYFNLSIPISYNFYAKIIVTFVASVIYILYSSIFFKIYLSIFQLIIVTGVFVNTSLISYIGTNYFYDKDSMVSSTYFTLFILIIMGFMTLFFNEFIFQLILHLSLMAICIVCAKYLFSSRRIRLKTL